MAQQAYLFGPPKRTDLPKCVKENGSMLPSPNQIEKQIGEIARYVEDASSGADRSWRVGKIFQRLFAPFASDETVRNKWMGRLMRERNRLVGERDPDGRVMGRPQASKQIALGLAQIYVKRRDLHERRENGSLKDLPVAALNILADTISREFQDDEQTSEEEDEWSRAVEEVFT